MQKIEESVGASLVAVCRAHRNRAAALLGEAGLYVGQEWILFRLRAEEGVTPSQLAESCDVEGPTISKGLQRMEKGGLITREQDSVDARASRIYLTDAGRDLANRAEELWQELERQTVTGLSTEERILLRRLLLQVRRNLP